jgi:hypothetical protein
MKSSSPNIPSARLSWRGVGGRVSKEARFDVDFGWKELGGTIQPGVRSVGEHARLDVIERLLPVEFIVLPEQTIAIWKSPPR